MTNHPSRKSSDRSSAARKRALRRMAKEFPDDWERILAEQHAKASLETWSAPQRRALARSRGWTELKKLDLKRYFELYHEETHGRGDEEEGDGGVAGEAGGD